MPVDFRKQKRFLELKKAYNFDIAVLKQSDNANLSENDLFNSLVLYDIQKKIIDEINEYASDVDADPKEMAALISVLFCICGEIIGNIARQDATYLVLYRKVALEQFEKHIKDLLNGRTTKNEP